MKTVREFSQSLLILLVAISLVNCSGGQNCDFGSADRPVRRGAAALPPCPVKGGGGGGGCSSTQKPTETLFSMGSTGTFLEFDISAASPPLVQICNSVAGTLGILAVAQPLTTTPFVYVLNASGTTGKIGAFAIAGGKSAALTAVTGQPFNISADTFTTGVNITTDPQGKFVFVTNAVTGKIHVFQIDLSTPATLGALTEVTGSPFSVSNPGSIAIDASDLFAYVTDSINGQIDIFDFDTPTTGALTPFSTLSITTGNGDFPNFALSALTTGSAELLYTANVSSVSAYAINADGSLTAFAGSPFQDAGLSNIQPIFLAVDGRFPFGSQNLYVMSANKNGILGYGINATGNLTLTVGSPFLANTSVHDITISGEVMYVQEGSGAGFGGTINPFAITPATGVLTAIPQTSTFTASTDIVTASTQ